MIRSMRREYDGWMPITKIQWDRNFKENILADERHEALMKKKQEAMDRNNMYARNQAYMHEQEINNRYLDAQQYRHYNDFYADSRPPYDDPYDDPELNRRTH
ncbi:hypothetical protein L1987_33123 [Smallanthus sonchifolius]|uniref:Uncharacterized protein n=1 Tax=Smallanthus sonchifolius TaxID=185202 RepID=A0ACB9HPM8_9ASTR|nr:hypothetical protein L1987_33123 [Smallanthus sonchifolius]